MSLLINHLYRFGDFSLDADERTLLRDGKPLPLAPKVLETLLILVENNGRIVEKDELMSRVWPDTFVEESNLTYSIQQLRKCLGDNARDPLYIETIPRRGYRFIANVEEVLSAGSPTSSQTNGLFGTFEVQSLDAANKIEAQESEPAITSANQSYAAIPEKRFDATAASSTSLRKIYVALAAATLIILAGAAFVLLRFSNENSSQNKRVDGKSTASVPLKLEKLTATGQSGLVAISPDGRLLAYTQSINKEPGIWLRQLATNTNVEIVRPTGPVYGLAFANRGEYLYFVKGAPPVLYRVSLHGGVPTRIVDKLEGKFSISSDDSQIAFIRQVINREGQLEYDLIIAKSDGTDERTLFGGIYPDKLGVPVWSPDGKSLICSYGNEANGLDIRVVEVRVDDGTKSELSRDRFFHITKMAWLPDKSGLILSARHLGNSSQLWRVSYPTMEITQITEGLSSYLDLSIAANSDEAVASQATLISDIWIGSSHDARDLKKITQAIDNFCWTPNGRLVYSSTASGNRDLWIMEPDGAEQRQLTVSAAVNGTPAVTPDGRQIVFMSNRTGAFQVWRMNIDGSNPIQLTSGAGKNFPSISPDGKWVFYNTTDDWHLWRVSIDGGDPIRLTEYIASHPSVSPDGKWIACVGSSESKQMLLILPIEGGSSLKRFDFAGSGSRLQWTPDGKALIYAGEYNGVTYILKQSLSGGPPEKVAALTEDELYDFGYSYDGKLLAVTRGGWRHDIVLITDLNRR